MGAPVPLWLYLASLAVVAVATWRVLVRYLGWRLVPAIEAARDRAVAERERADRRWLEANDLMSRAHEPYYEALTAKADLRNLERRVHEWATAHAALAAVLERARGGTTPLAELFTAQALVAHADADLLRWLKANPEPAEPADAALEVAP